MVLKISGNCRNESKRRGGSNTAEVITTFKARQGWDMRVMAVQERTPKLQALEFAILSRMPGQRIDIIGRLS